jgi:hypothetical protein
LKNRLIQKEENRIVPFNFLIKILYYSNYQKTMRYKFFRG